MEKIREISKNVYYITYELFRIMIPTIIIVKILQELGFVEILNNFLSPLMLLIGLPQEIAIVFTTTMLTSPYTGLAIFAGMNLENDLTIAQASVLGLLLLFTHSLPLEGLICRRAGVRIRVTVLLRLLVGFIFCFFLNKFFELTGVFSGKASILIPFGAPSSDLLVWCISQLKTLFIIFLVIICIVVVLEIFKKLGIERLIEISLKPFLNGLGIGEKASTIAVVGVNLGIGFGAGLLIQEVKSGKLHYKDVFGVIALISLLHSIIEDTGVVSLIGANIIITLFLRALITLLTVYVMVRIFSNCTEDFWKKYLVNTNIPPLKS